MGHGRRDDGAGNSQFFKADNATPSEVARVEPHGHYACARSDAHVVDADADNGTEDVSATTAAGSHSVAADLVKNQVHVPAIRQPRLFAAAQMAASPYLQPQRMTPDYAWVLWYTRSWRLSGIFGFAQEVKEVIPRSLQVFIEGAISVCSGCCRSTQVSCGTPLKSCSLLWHVFPCR